MRGKLVNLNAFYKYKNVVNQKNKWGMWWNFAVFEGILATAFLVKLFSNKEKVYVEFFVFALAALLMMALWFFLRDKVKKIQDWSIIVCYVIGFAFVTHLEVMFPGSQIVMFAYAFTAIDLAASFILAPFYVILGQTEGALVFLITYCVVTDNPDSITIACIVLAGLLAVAAGLLAWNIRMSNLIFANELTFLATGTDDIFIQNKPDGLWEDSEQGIFAGAEDHKRRNITFVFDERNDRLLSVREGNIFDLRREMTWSEVSTRILRYAGDVASYKRVEKFLNPDGTGKNAYEDKGGVAASFNMPSGERMWLSLEMTYRPNPVNGFMTKVVSLEDITGDKIYMGIMNMMLSENYDAVLCYERGKNRGLLLYAENGDIKFEKCDNYEEMMMRYATGFVADYDRERAVEAAHIKTLCDYLQEHDFFEIFIDEVKDGTIGRKRFYSSYMDDDKRFLVVFKQDVTDFVNSEKEVKEKLETALAEAKAANAVKTEFLARMSHEMRTPMNAIVGLASLVEDANGNPEQIKGYVSKIKSSSDYLLQLINDVLDMSGIVEGRLTMDVKEVRFADFLATVNTIVEPLCASKNIVYIANSEIPDNTILLMDKLRVSQIFTNLLDNAVKYTSEGGLIEFSCYNIGSDGNKGKYRFVVKDSGIGMTEEFAQRMFEPFAQEKETNRASLNGTGIGLSISKGIVDMLGGSISATSKPDVGTTFVVDIGFESVTKQEPVEEKSEEISVDCLKGKRVLVVEDNEINREIAVALLESQNIKAEVTVNGLEAVEAFDNSPEHFYDAILMDIRMPRMNGLEATRKIRLLNRRDASNIPIIAMTANAFSEDVELSVNSGMNAHLSKPINPVILYETLAKFISESK